MALMNFRGLEMVHGDQPEDEQRRKVISLLETAQALANDLQEHDLAYQIERTIDQARAGFIVARRPARYRAE